MRAGVRVRLSALRAGGRVRLLAVRARGRVRVRLSALRASSSGVRGTWILLG